MKPTQNWDRTTAQTGAVERLTPGGHICRIKGVEIRQSNKTGRDMLVLFIDVNEGTQFDGIMERTWKAGKQFGRDKWPNTGTMYTLLTDKDGNTNPRFKGLISAVEKSNIGYSWRWDEMTLKGKTIGVIFGEEEFLGNDGTVRTSIKPKYACGINELVDQPVPALKKLPESDVNGNVEQAGGFTEVQDDELPF